MSAAPINTSWVFPAGSRQHHRQLDCRRSSRWPSISWEGRGVLEAAGDGALGQPLQQRRQVVAGTAHGEVVMNARVGRGYMARMASVWSKTFSKGERWHLSQVHRVFRTARAMRSGWVETVQPPTGTQSRYALPERALWTGTRRPGPIRSHMAVPSPSEVSSPSQSKGLDVYVLVRSPTASLGRCCLSYGPSSPVSVWATHTVRLDGP